jgi:hypothetical protein
VSILKHFDQYQLSAEYGGVADTKYDITKLQETDDLVGFIAGYVDLKPK